MPADTSSYVSNLITNLKLLDLDLLDDWPFATLQVFSTHYGPQFQKQRIRSVEWALYRLFETWDPVETRNKLRPFFPPLEPLQSLNLRAALFRCLNNLKKRDLLGRDFMLRKTMLDECKGDKFEELLAAFSTLVVRKVVMTEVTGKECIARRLCLTQRIGPGDRELIQPLVVAHRVSLALKLRRKRVLKSRIDGYAKFLNVKEQELDRKAQSLQHTSDDRASMAGKEGEAIRRSISRAMFKLKKDVGRQWRGDPKWVATVLEGPRKGDAHDADDVVLDAPFDRIWSEYVHANMDEKKHQNNEPGSLLQDLEDRVAQQQDRLQRWRTLRKDMAHTKPARSPTKNELTPNPGVYDPKSRNLEKEHGHENMVEATGAEVKDVGKPSSAAFDGTPVSRRVSDAGTANRGVLTMERIPAPSADWNESVNPIRRKSMKKIPIGSHVRSSLSSLPQHGTRRLQLSSLTLISERISPGLPNPVTSEDGGSMHRQPLGAVRELDSTTSAIQDTLSSMDEDDATAQLIISSVMNAEASPVKAKPSLIERTRMSMAIPAPEIVSINETKPPSKEENAPKEATTNTRTSCITLLERTRQSMSILPTRAREPQKLRQSQSFPINQFVTPTRQQPDSNKEDSGKESTPRELLFAEEAGYASVFKSRPRIKISPISSPTPHGDSPPDHIREDYNSTVLENSPSRRATGRAVYTTSSTPFHDIPRPSLYPIANLAISRPVQLSFAAFLFISAILVLAPSARFTSRLSAIFNQIRPANVGPTYKPASGSLRPLTTASMPPQAFKAPPQAPPIFTGTPSSIIKDTKRLIEKSRALQEKVVAEVDTKSANFENVMRPQIFDENEMALEAHIIGFYQAVSTDQALRDASTEAEKLLDDFGIESSMNEDIFKLVDTVAEDGEKLDPESQRFLEKDRKSYIRNGLGLPAGSKRDRFKEIKKRLSQISIEFARNLNEEKGGIWFAPKELSGVPEDVLSGLQKGSDEKEGKIRLSFKYPDLFPALKYATNPATRKKVFINNENKCNQNAPLFREAIILRDEAARLLGYKNHAEFRIEDKMAKTPKTVDDFLGDLRQRLARGGAEEKKVLTKIKEEDLKNHGLAESFDGHYYLWDHRYYERLLLENEYSLDQRKVAEYFPIQTTIRGMLKIFEELFGLIFVEVTGAERSSISPSGKGDDIVWHPDVQVFSVWDDEGEGSNFSGYLYLDLFPREGKYGHAANFNLQPGFIDREGKRRYPATALVCNFSKPSAKKPSLLKHDEVVTLFHELGHGIHDLVSRTTYSRFHGTNTVRDFVEAPSQMLENWCWTPSQLKTLSHHYSTLTPEYEAAWVEQAKGEAKPGEKIPDELISNIIKTRHVNDALHNLRQLHFGIFDMTVHEPKSHEAAEELDITEKYNHLRYEITQLDGLEGYLWGNGQATFGHLMGGYDAGYYGYLSSQVYSTDMFYTVFAANPMNATEGRRYRHTVLERGGSQDEMQTLEDFLGRKPSTEAFYRELGLS